MEYRLEIDEGVVTYAVDSEDENMLRISAGSKSWDVNYSIISEHHIHLVIDGAGVHAFVMEEGDEKRIMINGALYLVGDADVLERAVSGKRGPQLIPRDVTPPMPSVVVRIMVAEGDRVQAGKGVIVVTAMKMETTLTAPFDGIVTKINVVEGDKVMPGEILVDIQEEQEETADRQGDPADS